MNIFTNREIAIAIWICVLFIWAMSNTPVRNSIFDVFKALFVRKLIIPLLILLFYVFLSVLFLKVLRFWDLSALKDTIFWTFGVAITSYFNITKVTNNGHYFRDFILDNVKLIAILEFIENLYSFRLLTELIVFPIVVFIILVHTVALNKPEYKQVKIFLDFILGLFGIFLLLFTVKEVIVEYSTFATFTNLRDFLLPLILSILFLPFIYLLALYVQYETLFVRIDIVNIDSKLVKKAKRKIFFTCFLDSQKLDKFSKSSRLLKINTDDDIDILISNIRNM